MNPSYTEDYLVEQPAIQFMHHELGWDVADCYGEKDGGTSDRAKRGVFNTPQAVKSWSSHVLPR